jgi:exopolyphosphatase/guanosine-5'-triphosphate,3'-diphosphate pyrophosphatase
LDQESRILLEVAALLHDIGQFVEPVDHHKHTYYLLHASPIIGLTPARMEIAANVARYHRKALPKAQHRNLDPLSARQRAVVSVLGGILRIANALDRDKAGAVQRVEVSIRKPKAGIRLFGDGDLLLERWAVAGRCDLFEEAFGVKVTVEGGDTVQ